MRNTILAMDGRDVARQLPNLVEEVVERVDDDVRTLQFVVGVSVSRNATLLDYRLERLVDNGQPAPRRETLKPPVSDSHRYLTFRLPPDPGFGPETLRGALLTALERDLADHGWPASRAAGRNGEDEATDDSWLAGLRRQLRGQS